MSTQKKVNTSAIVIKHVNYKDAHRIYTLLTKDFGKITAVARGVRKISSKRAGSLDSLNCVNVNLSQDKSGFYSINEIKVINSFAGVKSSLEYALAGMYFAELVDVFLEPDHPTPEIFNLLLTAITVLSKSRNNLQNPQLLVCVFEIRLLEKLGLGIHADKYPGKSAELLRAMKTEKDLAMVYSYDRGIVKQVNTVIKNHLKSMVETYARYPRLNRFLSENI